MTNSESANLSLPQFIGSPWELYPNLTLIPIAITNAHFEVLKTAASLTCLHLRGVLDACFQLPLEAMQRHAPPRVELVPDLTPT
jgi:hypothetical protein